MKDANILNTISHTMQKYEGIYQHMAYAEVLNSKFVFLPLFFRRSSDDVR